MQNMRMSIIKLEIVEFYNFERENNHVQSFKHLKRIVRAAYDKQSERIKSKYPSVAKWAEQCFLNDIVTSMKICSYDLLSELTGKSVNGEYNEFVAPSRSLVEKSFHFVLPYIRQAFADFDMP